MAEFRPALVIALLGAESTGKTRLAEALARRIGQLTNQRCGHVPEYLREWCDQHQRTPLEHEQAEIAQEQARRIEAAAAGHDIVLADTTPLMTAVYHQQVFGSSALDASALAWQRRHCALTLLTALDLPWQADGLQRDGPQVRAPVDARLRQLLICAGLPFTVVSGLGEARTDAALDALSPLLRTRLGSTRAGGLFTRLAEREAAQPAWRQLCSDCDDPACEHALAQARLSERRRNPAAAPGLA